MIPIKDDNPRSSFPFITVALIIINIAVFYFEFKFGFDNVIGKFGAIPSFIVQGQRLETLLTSMFLHGGILHIGGNMLYLWIFGDNIENYLGHLRFIVFYIFCGLFAVFAHIFIGGVSDAPMVGASGAIAGILGAYLIKYPKAKVVVIFPVFWFLFVRSIRAFYVLGIWFVLQLFSGLVTYGSEGGGVAFWAHIGGFVAGFILIFIFPKRKR